MGANFAEYDGWRLPADFSDPAAERAALENGCAAFDLSSFGRIAVKGNGAEQAVGDLVGNQTPLPVDGKWLWAAPNTVDKRLRIGRVKGGYLVLTPPKQRQEVLAAVQKIASEKQLTGLSIADLTEKTAMLGIYGPGAAEAVNNILPFDISAIEPASITIMSFFMISVTIIRGAWTGGDGIELICPASAAPLAAGAVAKYHERENITPAGMDCLLDAISAI
jgi:glycine cleavage system aminomethyltransferase T